MLRNPMHRQVLLLATAQALFQSTSVLVVTIGGLAGSQVSSPALATAPLGAMFLGNALVTVPASLWMARVGRRAGFIAGAALGTCGGLVAAAGVMFSSLVLLCAGTMLLGAYQAFALYYRFAASEVADDVFRPRAISFVLTGGIVAAFLGPALARWGEPLLAPQYTGSFVLVAAVSLTAALLLLNVRVPMPTASVAGSVQRPLWDIVKQPTYLVALFGAATGQGVMVLAMTASPLAIVAHHHSIADASHAIQFHVLGMFLPSFFTGALIGRFGILRVMFAGVGLLTGHVILALSGTALPHFISALTFLGVGWNFLFIGGTTLLTQAYTPAERGRAQAFNDLTVVLTGLIASASSGALLAVVGWQRMNMILLPWLAITALALIWFARHRRAAAAPSA